MYVSLREINPNIGDMVIAEYATRPMIFAGYWQGRMLFWKQERDAVTLFEVDEKAKWKRLPKSAFDLKEE